MESNQWNSWKVSGEPFCLKQPLFDINFSLYIDSKKIMFVDFVKNRWDHPASCALLYQKKKRGGHICKSMGSVFVFLHLFPVGKSKLMDFWATDNHDGTKIEIVSKKSGLPAFFHTIWLLSIQHDCHLFCCYIREARRIINCRIHLSQLRCELLTVQKVKLLLSQNDS